MVIKRLDPRYVVRDELGHMPPDSPIWDYLRPPRVIESRVGCGTRPVRLVSWPDPTIAAALNEEAAGWIVWTQPVPEWETRALYLQSLGRIKRHEPAAYWCADSSRSALRHASCVGCPNPTHCREQYRQGPLVWPHEQTRLCIACGAKVPPGRSEVCPHE